MGKLKYKHYTVIQRPDEYGELKYKYYTFIKRPDEYGKTEIQILHNHQEA